MTGTPSGGHTILMWPLNAPLSLPMSCTANIPHIRCCLSCMFAPCVFSSQVTTPATSICAVPTDTSIFIPISVTAPTSGSYVHMGTALLDIHISRCPVCLATLVWHRLFLFLFLFFSVYNTVCLLGFFDRYASHPWSRQTYEWSCGRSTNISWSVTTESAASARFHV